MAAKPAIPSDRENSPAPEPKGGSHTPRERTSSDARRLSRDQTHVSTHDSRRPDASGSETDAVSQEDSSAKDKPSVRRRHRRLIIIGAIVSMIAILVGGFYYWNSTFYESTDDAYIDGHAVSVGARVKGNIAAIHVADNQRVEQGMLLVEIDPCDYQAALAQAEAAVHAAKADEEQAVADMNVAGAQLEMQRQDLQRYKMLAKQGAATVQTLQHYQASFAVAQAQFTAAQKRVTAVRAQVAQLQAAVEQARLNLSYTQIRAPQSGYVTEKAVEKGSYVAEGQSVLAIVTDEMYVTANFKETQLTHMRPGQPVAIDIDAYPNLVLKGRVQSIQAGTGAVFSLFPPENATGNFVKVVQRVPVKIAFQEPDDPNCFLALGMSVEPKVRIK